MAAENISEDAKWFKIMALPPLRSLFETALGLPSSFGRIDIDQQLGVFRDRTQALTGQDDVAQFADAQSIERLVTIYQARSQLAQGSGVNTSGANALQLLLSARST